MRTQNGVRYKQYPKHNVQLRAQSYKTAPQCPASDASHKSRSSPVPLNYPSLGLINLLKQLTELRETFFLLDYWFIIKGYNSETVR